jgi:outer membrane protein assembly factor BamB
LPASPITIPDSALYGPHTIQATGQTSNLTAQATFFVETDWNQFGFDTERDHFNPYENVLNTTSVPNLALTWVAQTTSGISSEPVLANEVVNGTNTEVVYVTTHTNILYALDTATGKQLWSFSAPTQFDFGNSSAAVANELINGTSTSVVYAASGNNTTQPSSGELDALNATTGASIWSAPLDGSTTSPLVAKGAVYVGTTNHNLYAFNAVTGLSIWSKAVGGITTAPATDQTAASLFAGLFKSNPADTKVMTVNTANGNFTLSKTIGGTITSIALASGVLYVSTLADSGSTTPDLYAFQAANGQQLWTYTDPAGYGYKAIAVANGILYAGGGTTSSPWAGELAEFTLSGCTGATCSPGLTVSNSDGQNYNLTIANGVLYTSFADLSLKAFDVTTLSTLWTAPSATGGYGHGVAVANGALYVGSANNEMLSFSLTADWLEFGFDSQHSHANPFENVLNTTNAPGMIRDWTVTTGNYIAGSPAVARGVAYFGSTDQNLYAVNAITGKIIWKYPTGSTIYSSPAVATVTINGVPTQVVYIGTDNGKFIAINAATHKNVWSLSFGMFNDSPPNIATVTINGVATQVIYVASSNQYLYALNATTGATVWKKSIGNSAQASPTVANGMVYIGTDGQKMFAFDAVTGALNWSYKIAGAIASTASVATSLINGIPTPVVYFGSNDSDIYAVNATTGKFIWLYTTGGQVNSSPAIATETINGSATQILYLGSYDHDVYAFDITNGKPLAPLWTFQTGDDVYSSPAVANGVVYVGSYDHELYALDATNGNQLWNSTNTIGGEIGASPAVVNAVVYVGSYDRNFYAFHFPG